MTGYGGKVYFGDQFLGDCVKWTIMETPSMKMRNNSGDYFDLSHNDDDLEEPMQLAYVSGPYRDERGTAFVEENIRKAEDVAKELWQRGYAVICPHANTRHFDGICTSEEFIEGDLRMIDGCDLIVMLPGWHRSEGAKLELAHARDKGGIMVYYWLNGTMVPDVVAADNWAKQAAA